MPCTSAVWPFTIASAIATCCVWRNSEKKPTPSGPMKCAMILTTAIPIRRAASEPPTVFATARRSSRIREVPHGGDDVLDLLLGQMRTDRKTQNGIGELLGDWKRAAPQTKRRVRARKMRRDRIVNQRLDAARAQVLLQCITARMPDHEEMPHGLGPFRNRGKDDVANAIERS